MTQLIQKQVLLNLIQSHFGEQEKITGIEIGTLDGATVAFIIDNIPALEMITIDPEPNKKNLVKNLDLNHERVKLYELISDKAVLVLPDASFDFVWIDGDHSEEQCYRDIINYSPYVKKGGIVGGHDYGSNLYPGVEIAVKRCFDKIAVEDDLVWWTIKE